MSCREGTWRILSLESEGLNRIVPAGEVHEPKLNALVDRTKAQGKGLKDETWGVEWYSHINMSS